MIFFFGRELKILSFNEKKCKWYFFCMELKVLSSIEKNANDIFFGIEIRVLTFNEKNANNIFFGIVWFISGSQMNILLGFAFSAKCYNL